MDWNRYAYARYNPINNTDPTGHTTECGPYDGDYCSRLNREYSRATLWQQKTHYNRDDFIKARESYDYYMANPQAALEDSLSDTESYAMANTYSGYVLHQLFQPYGDDLVMQNVERARLTGDVTTYYQLLSAMAVMVWLTNAGGDKYSVNLYNGIKLNSTDALDAASQFLGKGYTQVEPGRYVSADGLRQVRMKPGDLKGHAGGPILKPSQWTW